MTSLASSQERLGRPWSILIFAVVGLVLLMQREETEKEMFAKPFLETACTAMEGQGRKRDKFHNLARRVNFGRCSARETRNNVVVAQLGHYDGWRGEDAPPSPKFGWQKGRNKGRRTESVGRRCRRAARTIIVQILRYYSSPSHPPPSFPLSLLFLVVLLREEVAY